MGGLSFGQDADGNWGYKIGGADPVVPFKSSKVAMGGFKFLGNNGNPNGATVDVGFKPDFIMYGFLGGSDMTKAFYNGGSGNDRTLALWWSELQREFIWDSASDNPPRCIRRSFPTGASTGNRLALQEVTDTGFKYTADTVQVRHSISVLNLNDLLKTKRPDRSNKISIE